MWELIYIYSYIYIYICDISTLRVNANFFRKKEKLISIVRILFTRKVLQKNNLTSLLHGKYLLLTPSATINNAVNKK